MWKSIRTGLSVALWNPKALTVLFVYQLVWGWALYRYVQQTAVPMLHHIPGPELPDVWRSLFLAESQFRLLKTDLANTALLALGAMLLLKMVATPVLQAYVFYAVHQTCLDGRRSIREGVREWALPFIAVYAVRLALTLAPLYWLYPAVRSRVLESGFEPSIAVELAPWLAAYVLYGAVLHLAFLCIQLGLVTRTSGERIAACFFLRFFRIAGISAILFLATIALAAAGSAVGWAEAGLATLIGFHLHYAAIALLRLWEIGAQHANWIKLTGRPL